MTNSIRGVSTALDVGLFLVLVTAAVGTMLVAPDPSPPDGTAEETAATLTTNTVEVRYSTLGTGETHSDASRSNRYERTAHGTVTQLLAEAAVSSVTVDGEPVTETAVGLRNALEAVLTRIEGDRVQVRAVWEPYPGAPLRGRVVIGNTPPPTASVDAAVVTVPSRMPSVRERVLSVAETNGYEGVTRLTADAIVRGQFPPTETRVALYSDGPTAALTATQYRGVAHYVGADVSEPLTSANTDEANRRLQRALTPRLERDLRTRFDTPRDAAKALAVSEVKIVVRTWSA